MDIVMENVMRCDQCRHWKPSDEWEPNAAGFRECDAVKTRWSIEDQATAGIPKYPEDEPSVEVSYEEVGQRWHAAHVAGFQKARAYVQDGSEYRAELFTGPDFFCALFEAHTPEER